MNRGVMAVVALAVVLIAGGWGLQASTSATRRPEGAAERFLHAVSIEDPDEIERWADGAVAASLTGFEADDDTLFATIEVGRAATGDVVTVPARVVRNDGADTEVHLSLSAVHDGGDPGRWRITGVETVKVAAVPSEGAPRPSRAGPTVWLALAAGALAAAVGADLLVTRLRR